MINFEYANPRSEAEAVELLRAHDGATAVLAGGTDLMSLLKADAIAPRRVVDIKNIPTLRGVEQVEGGLLVGALTTLDDVLTNPLLSAYRSLWDVADATHAIQMQAMGTLGGDLCVMPQCWYFRNGYGLLAMKEGESLVATGSNQYHAVFGNHGPAKFSSASRFSPALIAWGAKVRIVGPAPNEETWLPLEYFHVTPKTERQGVTVLQPGQFVTHILVPSRVSPFGNEIVSATYEALQIEGLDWPLGAAAVAVELNAGVVERAKIVLGHMAPMPWVAHEASEWLAGHAINEETASAAADLAIKHATPLSQNEYKVQIARACVKRALLKATGQLQLS